MHDIATHTGITIAIVKRAQDWQRLARTKQYHIPIQHSAGMHQSSWVAWYMPGWYSPQPHCIRYVSRMTDLRIMPRCTYIPDEPDHPHAHHLYAILRFDVLHELRIPLRSQHWRRIGIHQTTWGALMRAYDLSALSHITRRMPKDVSSVNSTYDLFDLCIPVTQTPDGTIGGEEP